MEPVASREPEVGEQPLTPADRGGPSPSPRLRRWAAAAPVRLSIGLFAAWMVVAGLGAAAWTVVSGLPAADAGPQLAGRVAGTALVLLLLWRARWLLVAGVSTTGSRTGWAVAAAAIVYLVPAYIVALFGPGSLRALPQALAAGFPHAWIVQASVGIAEELLFRGLLLVVLAAAWGRTGRGGLEVIVGVGLLFGAPHLVVIIGGIDPGIAILNALAAVVSGTWYAALVLAYGSIWPLVLVHATTNLAALVMPSSSDAAGYLRLIIAELPWLAFGVWLTLRRPTRRAR